MQGVCSDYRFENTRVFCHVFDLVMNADAMKISNLIPKNPDKNTE